MRGEHVFDFAGADAEGERAECAVRSGVAIAADHGHAGLGGAKFRSDDVADALMLGLHAEAGDAEFLAVVFELCDLVGGDGSRMGSERSVVGMEWSTVADGEVRAADFEAALAQAGEGLRRSDFVDQVKVDVEERGRARLLVDDVGVPDFLTESC